MGLAAAQGSRTRSNDGPVPVSVICTARNAAPTIEATIRSIQAQDFRDWEMIVVDDGSTDDTVGLVNRLAETDPRIRLVVTGGLGRGRALNRALGEARADLVANIDADDESHPSRLRYQVEAIKRYPELAVVSSEWFRVYDAARPIWPEIDAVASFEVEEVTKALAIGNQICHSSAMMRRAAITGLGGYSEKTVTEDYDLWVRCAASGLRLGRIQLPLVAKRIHPGQHFLHSGQLRYRSAGLQVQLRAMRILGVRTRDLPLFVVRFLWSMIPQNLRHTVTRIGAGRRIGQIRIR